MAKRARLLLLPLLLFFFLRTLHADGRFDLVGPRIDVRVTRGTETLPIASVPNLQPGDKIWLHPDLPPSQSVKYLLICVFLRGTTNPPPQDWFTRIETWDKKVREEGVFVTVPPEAQQAVLFMAPETGGDFSTLRSAVQGRPGVFVRASQDLAEAGFEQARIEKYLASIRRVPPSDSADLQKHSDLLARTLNLKPNEDCFKRPVDTQFTCLTQTGTQTLLDDGHGQNIASALSNGPGSDLINQASYTQAAGGGLYSAYVGAIVDLIRLMGTLHTAQYQYIPAIAFPQDAAMNLRLNTPPSFHNPKSVLVIGLPSVQAAVSPPLRPADANYIACLIKPSVVLPIEGAPLVFSTDFSHEVVLHLNPPPGAPAEPDIPLIPDAYQGGLVLQQTPLHHRELHDPKLLKPEPAPSTPAGTPAAKPDEAAKPDQAKTPAPATPAHAPQPKPVLITGTIQGRWGFDPFTGPTVTLQQLPGTGWHIVEPTEAAPNTSLIAGRSSQLLVSSTGSACIHTITAHPTNSTDDMPIQFKPSPKPEDLNLVNLSMPLQHAETPGNLHLAILQYGQPKTDDLAARTFSEPAHIVSIELHAGDRSLLLKGTSLAQVERLSLGDLNFSPVPPAADDLTSTDTLRVALPADSPAPPTHVDDHLTARIRLRDGRNLSIPVVVSLPRPVITLLRKNAATPLNTEIALTDSNDLPLSQPVSFTLKSPAPFPRNGQIEIETLDGTLRTVLTLAPSGGLLLQDPHTVVATLDPLRSFGPSAFGPLHLRAVYPLASNQHVRRSNEPDTTALAHVTATDSATQTATTTPASPAPPTTNDPPAADSMGPEAPSSDWLPLGTLVRLPTLSGLQCPVETTLPCTLSGSNLFLIESISIDPTFANPIPVPDGYTGSSLTLPRPSAATIFLHLRDDPTAINPAIIPTVAPPPPTVSSHTHNASRGETKTQTQQPQTPKGPA